MSERHPLHRPASLLTLDAVVEEGLGRLLRASGLAASAPGAPLEFAVPLEKLVEAARREPSSSTHAWAVLASRLGLTHLETLAGVLALKCECDARIADCVRRLQAAGGAGGPARPTLGLVAHLWSALEPRAKGAEARLLALLCAGRAVADGALVLGPGDALLTQRTIAVHPALVPPLADTQLGAADRAVFGELTARRIAPPARSLPQSWQRELPAYVDVLSDTDARLLVRCHDLGEARGLAAALAERAGRDAMELPPAAHWPAGLLPWLLVRHALPVVVCDPAPGERILVPSFPCTPLLIAAGLDGDIAVSDGLLREWRPALPRLAERPRPQILPSFGALAQVMRTELDDTALVTTPALRRDLDALRARCLHRETLTDALGAAARARARTGVAALFVGASGTGKTLAAQWLAHALKKPLLRVDAANVTSKYIGETEKNLARLFARAEHIDCVLLFDEADAMFGSRTEVKQSNDRFANAQTNYLLTRIESFEGIAILTSNSKARFDDAFMRRLDDVIEFPLPDAQERAALWRVHLGARHRLSAEAIDLIAAEADLPGGHIRNAAIGAALRACGRNDAAGIGREDVLEAIADEYRKLGRHAPDGLGATS